MVQMLRDMIGLPPVGFEWLEYVFAGVLFLTIFQIVTDLFRSMGKFFGGR